MSTRDEVMTLIDEIYNGEHVHNKRYAPLTPEQRAGYSSVTRAWQELSLSFIDETLDMLYEQEHIDPEYVLLPRDDLKHLLSLIARGTHICIRGSHSTVLEQLRQYGTPYINQTTGRLMKLAIEDTLPKNTLKILYKLEGGERMMPSGYIETNEHVSKEDILLIEAEIDEAINKVLERHGCTYHELPKRAIVHDVSLLSMGDLHAPVLVALTYQKRLYKGILQEIELAHE